MFRVEEREILYLDIEKDSVITIKEKYYDEIKKFLLYSEESAVTESLNDIGILQELSKNKEEVLKAMDESLKIKAPKNSFCTPMIMNIELTTKCPLRCPQCYCHLNQGVHIDKNIAINYIKEAGKLKIPSVNLSGGETLEYPYIYELISACKENNIAPSIALSGCYFNEEVLNKLIKSGVHAIYISLNGSTEKINSKTRDGYSLAINALQVLKNSNFENYHINWVAHDYNIDDFENLVKLAKKYNTKSVCVLAFKPDAEYKLDGAPKKENFLKLGKFIKSFKDDEISIDVEPCYSPLKAYIGQNYFFNNNTGKQKGCGAGRDGISISVNGKISPCRHIEYSEEFNSIYDYWHNSEYLKKLRSFDEEVSEPCLECKYSKYCTHCAAINLKINKKLYKGNEYCALKDV